MRSTSAKGTNNPFKTHTGFVVVFFWGKNTKMKVPPEPVTGRRLSRHLMFDRVMTFALLMAGSGRKAEAVGVSGLRNRSKAGMFPVISLKAFTL